MSSAGRWRRAWIAPLLLAACACAQAHDDDAAAAARLPQRIALLARAQAELERGDAAASLDDFERAAMMLHAADAELGLVRAAMQDGQYRRALAFCAHTAGEHADADGGAFYAWLLRIGGQDELAARTIADTRSRLPGDAEAAAVAGAFQAHPAIATGLLLQPLHRMAPWPVMLDAQAPPPASLTVSGSAVLVDDGATALVPLASIPAATPARAWVRNGLGQTTEATWELGDATLVAHGLARLRLRTRLPVGASREAAGRAPFAGSPGYALQFGAGSPAWPALTQGFLGGPTADSDVRKLGFGATTGAGVLDAQGALIGIVLASSGGPATWLPLSAAATTPSAAAMPVRPGPALVAPDEIYEAGLRRVLQLLVEPSR